MEKKDFTLKDYKRRVPKTGLLEPDLRTVTVILKRLNTLPPNGDFSNIVGYK